MQNSNIEEWERKHEKELRDEFLKTSLIEFWNDPIRQRMLAETLEAGDDPDMFRLTEVTIIDC